MKREMRVSFVKPEARDEVDTFETAVNLESVGVILQDTLITAFAGVLMYVVADTIRQVIINKTGGQ